MMRRKRMMRSESRKLRERRARSKRKERIMMRERSETTVQRWTQ